MKKKKWTIVCAVCGKPKGECTCGEILTGEIKKK